MDQLLLVALSCYLARFHWLKRADITECFKFPSDLDREAPARVLVNLAYKLAHDLLLPLLHVCFVGLDRGDFLAVDLSANLPSNIFYLRCEALL